MIVNSFLSSNGKNQSIYSVLHKKRTHGGIGGGGGGFTAHGNRLQLIKPQSLNKTTYEEKDE